jgi:hypothetical protein
VKNSPDITAHRGMDLLKIPPDTLPKLLPDERLSVNDFLSFPFPFVAAMSGQKPQSTEYFSTQLPNITDITVLQTLPTPIEMTVRDLLKTLQSSTSNRFKSITFPRVASISTSRYPRRFRPGMNEAVAEDDIMDPVEEEEEDDSDVSLRAVIAETHKEEPTKKWRASVATRNEGGLMSIGDAERLDISENEAESEFPEEGGRGKRVKKANKLYNLQDFARHWDDEPSDTE